MANIGPGEVVSSVHNSGIDRGGALMIAEKISWCPVSLVRVEPLRHPLRKRATWKGSEETTGTA